MRCFINYEKYCEMSIYDVNLIRSLLEYKHGKNTSSILYAG